MTYYKSKRIIDGKPRWVVIDENSDVTNRYPSKDELIELEREIRTSYDTRKDYANYRKYTDKELLDFLIQFYKEYGRVPTVKDFNNLKYPNFATYQRRFGSWSNALKLVELDVNSMVIKGILSTSQQKGRLAEIKVINQFKTHPIDLAGENCTSSCDGICPNGKIYEVKGSKLILEKYYVFKTNNKHKEHIEIYYFIGFNEDWTKLEHGWRVPEEIVEKDHFVIGLNASYEFNIENMGKYEITDKLIEF